MVRSKPAQAWIALEAHAERMHGVHMRDLFATDPNRFGQFSMSCCGILLDYAKNRITRETLELLFELARETDVEGLRQRMFEGRRINETEHRAALHTALRAPLGSKIAVQGENVMPKIAKVQERMRQLSDDVREGVRRGATGKLITDVVNIGIGGSHLGPQLMVEALIPYASPTLSVHFLSGVDRATLDKLLSGLSWERTLFIISSKSMSTQETMMNAIAVRAWFLERCNDNCDVDKHFVAVTSRSDKAADFGISESNVFEMWDWVGGRYSLWSAVGLPMAMSLGMDGFEALLAGAHEMDRHFLNAPMDRNMPIIMALLGVWYVNFHGVRSHAVVPYSHLLRRLPDYLQQLDMESNGKGVTLEGETVSHATGPVIWGGVGTGAQHSFFQRLHQGEGFVPVDFIAASEPNVALDQRNATLLANCFAQSQALMRGKTEQEVRAEMQAAGEMVSEIDRLAPHKVFPGDRPSNTLLLKWLDPKTLGALIALYEHKVAVQGFIWQIDSFDQWGVELGKTLASEIGNALKGRTATDHFDSSTCGLIDAARGGATFAPDRRGGC